jgi:hypothetical protein
VLSIQWILPDLRGKVISRVRGERGEKTRRLMLTVVGHIFANAPDMH